MGRGPKRQLCSEQPSGTYRSVSQHCPSGILPETGKVRKILCSGKAASNAESNFAETFGEAR